MISKGTGRLVITTLVIVIVLLAGTSAILASSRFQSATIAGTSQTSSQFQATVIRTQTIIETVSVEATATMNTSSPQYLGADASPCYNSEGDYYAANVSQYAECASNFLSLGYNENLNVSGFQIAPEAGYPFCFGQSPCNCYGYPPCEYVGNPATVNSSTGQSIYDFPVYGFGAAYLVINYNATQETSVKIFLDKIVLETPPSLNSTLDGANWGYNGQLHGYQLYFPMNTLGGFNLAFFDNSTKEDSITLSMSFLW